LNAVFQGYIPRSILEFVTNLKLGDQPLPVVEVATNPLLKEVALGMNDNAFQYRRHDQQRPGGSRRAGSQRR
jgi:hypothetical protein